MNAGPDRSAKGTGPSVSAGSPSPADYGPEPPRLGALEAKVMDVLWDEAGLSVRELIERLGGTSAYTTIATVLSNLSRKDLVAAERSGHSTRYHPALSRAEHTAAVMGHALAASKDREASILHFVETMPAGDLELLRGYLDRQAQQAES